MAPTAPQSPGMNEHKILGGLAAGQMAIPAERYSLLVDEMDERIRKSRQLRAAYVKSKKKRKSDAPFDPAWKERLTAFYNHYLPEVVQSGRVDLMARQYHGREKLLLARLVNQFGPEPECAGYDAESPTSPLPIAQMAASPAPVSFDDPATPVAAAEQATPTEEPAESPSPAESNASPLKYHRRRRASTIKPGTPVVNVRDKYGFIVEDDDVHELLAHHEASPARNAALRDTCAAVEALPPASDDPTVPAALHDLLLESGIPEDYRQELWFRCSGARRVAAERGGRERYLELLADKSKLSAQCKIDIDKDMDRTFPTCKQFERGESTREELYDVLTAFCIEHEDIGYCQGMNFIAGILLLYLDDWEAFFLLCEIVNGKKFNEGYYRMGLAMMHLDQAVLKKLVVEKLPGVVEKLEEVNLNLEALVVKWFLCIFVDSFPLQTTLVLWDFYFIHGIPFIFSACLAFLAQLREKFLATDDLGLLMMMVRKEASLIIDPLPLVRAAMKDYALTGEELARLRGVCKEECDREKAETERRREEMRRRREEAAQAEARKAKKKRGLFSSWRK
eukprot:TRINITY_DN735_c0_g1_i3.p1 TRINITY_DN735_c0_g1~~TRINITY_DN735_c0_g1_i3.p1  ORF type:complete len:565 (+),score=264.85 TRINITY_DN735_c0_g1_i3:110-1804(+)